MTPFIVLLAAFAVLLQRTAAQDDIVVGTPVTSRTRRELEPLIGLLLTTLVLRIDLSGNPTTRELLARARRVCMEAYAHQDLPFEKLVEALKPDRRLQTPPIFQVMFAYQHAAASAPRLAGLTCHPVARTSGTAKFDLSLSVTESPTRLSGALSYDTDLFERSTIERLAASYVRILAAFAGHRDRRIGDIALLSRQGRARTIASSHGPPARPAAPTLQAPFEAQAARAPDAIAVRHGDAALTYAALDRRANQLAHVLRRRGVGPEVRAGICLRRTPDMVVALLGVLKAGGAYVPLDPAYPPERLRYMAADSRAAVVVSDTATEACVRDLGVPVIRMDADEAAMARESPCAPPAAAGPGHLAYVIYTSGSTGQPKGVALEHRNAAAFLRWSIEAFGAEELRAVLASTSLCFDLSVFELFAPLCAGGSAVLCQNLFDVVTDPAAADASLINTVPSAMAALLRLGPWPASAATINLAGEPLPRALVDALHARPGVMRVLNLYGPSEDTTYSTWACVRPGEPGPVTIGRPLAGTQAYVAGERLEPAPVGTPGELLIGGRGVARGYLDRPDLTAETFIPDHLGGGDGGRLYRTGDLARWLHSGELAFLGRLDHQVKLRGFRIELGEVEAALARHPRVHLAAAAVAQPASSEACLVAYVVYDGTPGLRPDDLRRFLAPRLPAHLIPSAFVQLASMPMTPSGKIDRRALPAPGAAPSDGTYVAPRTPVEQALSRIWADVLRVDRVGAYDNFFDLGGHSLLAVQVVARIRDVLRIERPLHVLFERPTLFELAADVDQAIREVLLARVAPARQEASPHVV